MKVLWISNLYPSSAQPNRATFNRQHVESLSRFADVRVIAPVAWPEKLAAWKQGKKTQPLGNIQAQYPTYFFTPRLFRAAYGQFLVASIKSSWSRWAQSWAPDIIVGSWAYPDGYAALKFASQASIPAVIKVHGSDVHSLSGAGRIEQTTRVLSDATGILSVSQDLSARMQDLGISREKIQVIYNGVDQERFDILDREKCREDLQLKLGQNEKLILYVGNLKPVKGVDQLIRGFANLARTEPGARLSIVGQGSHQGELQNICQSLGCGESVTFHGAASHADIPRWIGACDVFALCSRNEGVPNVLLESMASGRPCVASRVGGIPEVIENEKTGYLVDAASESEVAQSLRLALNNSWSAIDIRDRSQRFSWDRNAEATEALLKQCIDRYQTASNRN